MSVKATGSFVGVVGAILAFLVGLFVRTPNVDTAKMLLEAGAVGVLGVVFIFLIRAVLKHLSEQRTQFLVFLGNHMSENTKALTETVRAAQKLADDVEANTAVAVQCHMRNNPPPKE